MVFGRKVRTSEKHRFWEDPTSGGKWDFGRKIRFWERWACWDLFSWEHWFAWENGFSEETVLLSKIGLGDNGPLGGKVYLCRFIYIHYKGLGFGRQKGFVRIFCLGGGGIGIWEEHILGKKIGFGGNVFFLGGEEESGYLEEMGSGRNGVLEETGAWQEKVVWRKSVVLKILGFVRKIGE